MSGRPASHPRGLSAAIVRTTPFALKASLRNRCPSTSARGQRQGDGGPTRRRPDRHRRSTAYWFGCGRARSPASADGARVCVRPESKGDRPRTIAHVLVASFRAGQTASCDRLGCKHQCNSSSRSQLAGVAPRLALSRVNPALGAGAPGRVPALVHFRMRASAVARLDACSRPIGRAAVTADEAADQARSG
jgi:hypothetical protein